MYISGVLIVLLFNIGTAEAFIPGLCYILDGILVIYGIVLTILYCRLRMRSVNNEESVAQKTSDEKPEGIYEGLKHGNQDTYETLHMKKQLG